MIPTGYNQSEKASTSIASTDYWLLSHLYVDVIEKTANTLVDVRLQVRTVGKVFREVLDVSAVSGQQRDFYFDPFLIIPANSDVRLIATGSVDNLEVAGGIHGYLATIVNYKP